MRSLEEIEVDAINRDIPIMQKAGIQFLIDTLNDINAKSVLEIGSAIGYSSMMMATYVDGLQIDTIELNDDRYYEAKKNISEHELNERIHLIHDDALLFDINYLEYQPYDCLFIDAAKAQYQKFFEKYISLVKENGIVVVDNLDFHGMIHDIEHIKNRNTKQLVKKIKRFRDWIFNHELYDVTYYEIGDGICIIRRK